jgi:hypothetical protein
MRRCHRTDASPIGCNSRRTEQLLGQINLKSPAEKRKIANFRLIPARRAVFRRNLPEFNVSSGIGREIFSSENPRCRGYSPKIETRLKQK